MNENIEELNLNKKWLHEQLNVKGIHSLEEVFYAEIQQDGSLYVDKKDDLLH